MVDDEALIGRALSNLGTALTVAGRGEEVVSELRSALMRHVDPYVCFRICQTLAFHFGLLNQPDVEKHRFYTRLAYNYAEKSGDSTARVCAHHEMGLALAARSSFEAAREFLSNSLQLMGDKESATRSVILSALGYCRAQDGNMADGMQVLYRALRVSKRTRAPIYEVACRLFLAWCLLELQRPREAERHCRIALQLADLGYLARASEEEAALFLLGEAQKMMHQSYNAHDTFLELQTRFRPKQEGLAEILMGVDARRMVNLLL